VGARQNRVLNLSLLLPAMAKTVMPVSCVEQGRWRYESRGFSASRNMVFASAKMSKSQHVTRSLREEGTRHSDQGDVWNHVEEKLSKLGSRSATMAMDEVFADFDTDLDAFGNMQIEVANSQLALRFTKDRNDRWVEVRPVFHQAWLSLFGVAEIIRPELFDPDTGKLLVGVEQVFKIVLTIELPRLLEALGREQHVKTRACLEERSRARFPTVARANGISEKVIAQMLRADEQIRKDGKN
jgi:hypothetical protein